MTASNNDDRDPKPDVGGSGRLGLLKPLTLIDAARKRVPAVNYALGLAALAAAGALIVTYLGPGRAAVIIVALVLIGSILLWLFSRLTLSRNKNIERAGIFLIWVIVIFFAIFLVFTVTAFAFEWPGPWARFLGIIEPPPQPGYRVGEIASNFTAGAHDELGNRIKRAFERDIRQVASTRFPLAGDEVATRSQSVKNIFLVFLQSKSGVVKLQKIALPMRVRQLKGVSHTVLDDGKSFEATTWAFVREGSQFNLLEPIRVTAEPHWRLSDAHGGKELFFLAYYEGDPIISTIGKGYAGAEIDDLAGNIESLTVVIGGRFGHIEIDNVYTIIPSNEPTLIPFKREELAPVSNPRVTTDNVFAAILGHVQQLDLSVPELRRLTNILSASREARATGNPWLGITLPNVRSDVVITLKGQQAAGLP